MALKLFHKIYPNAASNQTIIILHGLFGMLDNWHKISQILSEDFQVVSVDLRNHGQSPHSDEMSFELMADDLNDLLKELNLESAIILGHSMGGKIAMSFANSHPDLVEKLIIVDIAPKKYMPGHNSYFIAFKELNFSSFERREQADQALAKVEPSVGVRQFLLKNLERRSEGGYRLKLNIEAIERFYNDLIAELHFQWIINAPTLFIGGVKSNYILEEDKQDISEVFTNVNFESIEDAGHWVHADQPMKFISTVREFVLE